MRRVDSNTLTTERLVLRPFRRQDEADLLALVTDPVVMHFVGDGVMTAERGRRLFEKIFEVYETGAWGVWAVEERETGRFAGSAEIKPRREGAWAGDWEIVYILARVAWGQGYATEIGRALVRFGLQCLGLPRVIATVDRANVTSIRVLEKIGMRLLGEDRDELGPYPVYGVVRSEPPPRTLL